jgi:hypothetical protein
VWKIFKFLVDTAATISEVIIFLNIVELLQTKVELIPYDPCINCVPIPSTKYIFLTTRFLWK